MRVIFQVNSGTMTSGGHVVIIVTVRRP